MPSFRLLSDSDEEQPKPHRTQKSLSKRKRSIAALKHHVDLLPSSSSDTDPSWNFRKKYLGGEHLPDGVEWGSDLESSFNTDEIQEMSSETEVLLSEPVGSPSKIERYKQSNVL
ncbi:unnamed protein product [Cuscuta campestris]|uniref:Uncharacterized protein n=1 Tax=Cuscuta campestris TaxID=132261 RepID=A0A484KDP2_9ASTE|nr:unnamed protein product [Cuscuta campestris]